MPWWGNQAVLSALLKLVVAKYYPPKRHRQQRTHSQHVLMRNAYRSTRTTTQYILLEAQARSSPHSPRGPHYTAAPLYLRLRAPLSVPHSLPHPDVTHSKQAYGADSPRHRPHTHIPTTEGKCLHSKEHCIQATRRPHRRPTRSRRRPATPTARYARSRATPRGSARSLVFPHLRPPGRNFTFFKFPAF